MQEIVKKLVDDTEYEFHHLNPFQSADLLRRILTRLLKPLGSAFTSIKQAAGVLDEDIDVEKAFYALADNLDREIIDILKELLSVVRLGTGMEIQTDVHFRGRLLHMLKVAYGSFAHNYADFLAEKSGVLDVVRRTLTQARAMSTGSSGESSSQGSQPLPKSMRAGR